MSKLERWLPFMFKKKDRSDKRRDEQASDAQQHALAPQVSQYPMAPLAPMFSPPMQQLVRDFFYDPFFREPFSRFGEMSRWFGDFAPTHFSPSVEVSDEGKALKVSVELPGMEKDDVQLQLEDDLLVISGEKKGESESRDEGIFRTERYYGYFQRVVPLPQDVDRDKAEAKFRKGVLTVRFPKRKDTSEPSRRIEIQT